LGELPANIPAKPEHVYAGKGWKSMGDWLGTDNIATFRRKYRPFLAARTFAHKLQLNSSSEWRVFAKGLLPKLGQKPKNIPACPDQAYAGNGWKSYGDWLGTGRSADHLKKYRNFR
jgi:hypothetical protein